MSKLRVVVTGAGYFSQFHLQAWRRIEEVALVGVCDRELGKARAAVRGEEAAFDLAAVMLDQVRPDLVDIATPPATHAELVELCAARRLDVVCQKPLAPTLAEAEAIVAGAGQAGIRLVVHENFRFQPWYREARRLLDEGVLGTPHSVAFRLRPGDGQGPDAYLARQPYFQGMERFLVHETAIHFIDTFRFLLGEAVAVTARLRRVNPHIKGEDAGYMILEFGSGATGLFDGNRLNDHVAANPRLTMGEMWLEGSDGVLRLDGDGRLFMKPHGGLECQHAYAWSNQAFAGDAVLALQRHVVDHLLRGTTVENCGTDYLVNMRIEEAVYRSSEESRRVVL